ncbi:unnamed protein product [Eruca vesicaria subsp. sativa]|uniref:Uncharacterized protein n=1 Tax=Eruca vesicaria subsp. sativa TaxID=29727 RepID=A0ABC8LQR3_ERUVS|nr:unnamed protein product [Eruca vesicaria subsp. sativa]
MDWENVAAEDVIEALREVEWSTPPCSLGEFVSRFVSQMQSLLDELLYPGLALITRPLAIVGAAFTA